MSPAARSAAPMKLCEVDDLVARLRREFRDVHPSAILQMVVTAAETVADAPTQVVHARRVGALCRAGLRLDWNAHQFQHVVRSLGEGGSPFEPGRVD